jgi:hypothetical protein
MIQTRLYTFYNEFPEKELPIELIQPSIRRSLLFEIVLITGRNIEQGTRNLEWRCKEAIESSLTSQFKTPCSIFYPCSAAAPLTISVSSVVMAACLARL